MLERGYVVKSKISLTLEPHPDIELGWKRNSLEAVLTLPSTGINEETGVILMIPGFDGFTDTNYFKDQMIPSVADKTNCIVVETKYFGILRNNAIGLKSSFLYNLNRIYDTNLTVDDFKGMQTEEEYYRKLAEVVIDKGITSLDIRCQPTIITGKDEYQSWGFLPAIDCLQVLGEVLKRYDINKKRIFAYGNTYGGYMALLLGKYAPHTFAAIIDRSGYSRTELKHVACGQITDPDYVYAFNIRYSDLKFTIGAGSNNPWTIEDEYSPFYFSDCHRKIRSLLEEKHFVASSTKYFIFHSDSEMTVAPISDKDALVQLLKKYKQVEYNRFPRLEGIEALAAEQFFETEDLTSVDDLALIDYLLESKGNLQKDDDINDFSLNSKIIFDCGERNYTFEFSEDYAIKVSLSPI